MWPRQKKSDVYLKGSCVGSTITPTPLRDHHIATTMPAKREPAAVRWSFSSFAGSHVAELVKPSFTDDIRFLVYQIERAPTTGALHVQGYVEMYKPKRVKGLNKWYPAHHEKSGGNAASNIEYCTKEGRIEGPWQFGAPQAQGSRTDLASAIETGKNRGIIAVIDDHPQVYAKYHNGLEKIVRRYLPKRNFKTIVEIHYGAARVGKTRQAWDRFPDLYEAMIPSQGKNSWFDDYAGQEVVLFDEFQGQYDFCQLKRLLDRYPMKVEVKNGTTQWAPRRIIITSNRAPNTWYPKTFRNEQQLAAFVERIEHTYQYFGTAGDGWAKPVDLNSLFRDSDQSDEF